MEIKLTPLQTASYLGVVSQMFFTFAVSYVYLCNDKILDFKIIILGYFLLIISFFTLVLAGKPKD